MFPRINPFIAIIHVFLLLLQLPRVFSALCACMLTCLVDVSSFFFFLFLLFWAFFFVQLITFFEAISFVTFELH